LRSSCCTRSIRAASLEATPPRGKAQCVHDKLGPALRGNFRPLAYHCQLYQL
jgi:hypothetical protein